MSPSAVLRRWWDLQRVGIFARFGFVRNGAIWPFKRVNVSMLRSLIHSHNERIEAQQGSDSAEPRTQEQFRREAEARLLEYIQEEVVY